MYFSGSSVLMRYNVKDKERMDKVEIWEVLVMLSGNEISLKEAHEQICYLSGVSNRTWSSDEIINQLYQFESIDEAKRWFSEYGC
jgi:hypothetical protein